MTERKPEGGSPRIPGEATTLFKGKPYRIFRNGKDWDCQPEDQGIVDELVAKRKLSPMSDGTYKFISHAAAILALKRTDAEDPLPAEPGTVIPKKHLRRVKKAAEGKP